MEVTIETQKPSMRASSGTDEKHKMILKNLYELLECPVCTTIMSPPIHQCPNGHTLCSICKFQVKSRCPICRIDMGSIRCLALEKVAEPLKVPYNCPYSGSQCSVTGNIPELVTHLKDGHNIYMHNEAEFTHCCTQSHKDDNVTGMLGVYNCYGRQFCYHFEYFLLDTSPCYIAFMQFMGDDNDAENFRYSLEIVGNCRKLSWQGVPSSIRHSHLNIQDSLDGLAISPSMALLFSDRNKKGLNLLVKGRIWMYSNFNCKSSDHTHANPLITEILVVVGEHRLILKTHERGSKKYYTIEVSLNLCDSAVIICEQLKWLNVHQLQEDANRYASTANAFYTEISSKGVKRSLER
ncbi:hypothetical protein CTI12_AA277410 [Artemisia annua]|uniref:RING-type domain-containing protein n=1 Tax=Artemisia annua TaxID=35608 RepID=A0A2U1NE45_ARTAN|nr:hypothetical protein CTI12_AA277410 [Artemisia annua]